MGEGYKERRAKTAERATTDLMAYAARAERSTGDAIRLMKNWGVAESERVEVMARLVKDGFIDDRRFAGAYVREKSRLSGWGIHKITAGLRAKGVAKEIIADVLSSDYDGDDARDRLLELLGRKIKSVKGTNEYEIKGKLLRFGLSRGYQYDVVVEAVERVMTGIDS